MKFLVGIILAVFILAPTPVWVEETSHLTNIDISTNAEHTRITMLLDKQIDYTLGSCSSKNTLTITLANTKVSFPEREFEIKSFYVENLLIRESPDGMEIVINRTEMGKQYRCFTMSSSSNLIIDIGLISHPPFGDMAALGEEYIISPQDVFKITVYEHPELTSTVKVSSAGSITFPLLGKVKVAGLSASQVQEKMEQLLGEKYLVNPQVMVNVTEPASIYILGQVKKPGVYKLTADLTVVEAITMAGGFTRIANQNKTKVARTMGNSRKTIKVPVADIIRGRDKSKDIRLQAGDIIVVPESFF